MAKEKILAIIAARKGSKGLKNKNIKILAGKPLIAHTIGQAIRWAGYDKFIVSTDSKEIANIARRHGAEIPFMRPANLASDTAGKLQVLRHALKEAEKHYGTRFDIVVDLDATAPLRTIKDIDNIVKLFKKARPDCIFSAVKARRNPYFNMVEQKPDGSVKICKKLSKAVTRRQSAPEVFAMNGSLYVYSRNFLLDEKNKTPYAKKAMVYEMDEVSAFDIDTDTDFKIVEFFIKKGIYKRNR